MGLRNGCELLENPDVRQRLSGALESALMRSCGQAAAPAPDSARKVKPRLRESVPSVTTGVGSSDVLINDPSLDSGGTIQSETTVAVHGDVICAAWNDSGEGFGANGFSGFGFSLDGGETFQDGGPFPDGGASNRGDPSLAYSARDAAFYYAALTNSGLGLWKSTDDCQSFSVVGPIHLGSGDDKEMMAADNTESSPHFGRLYVGWTDFATFDTAVVSFSDDGGLSWSLPGVLAGSGFNAIGMWPAVAPNGDVYFALVNRGFDLGGVQDQWIYQGIESSPGAVDGGVETPITWIKRTDIATSQLRPESIDASSFCGRQALNGHIRNLSSAQIGVHADASAAVGYVLHATYPYDSDGPGPDNSNVFYRRSFDGAQTWSDEIQLNDDATSTDQFYPALGVDRDGIVVVSWYDRRLDPLDNLTFDRFVTSSFDGGQTWSSNERLSDVSSPVGVDFEALAPCYHGDYDQVAVAEGIADVVWSDDRRFTETGPNPDVYHDRIVLEASLGRLSAEPRVLRCDATLNVRLADADLTGASSAQVSIAVVSGDSEALTLLENAARLGTFSAQIDSSPGPATSGDGVLQVQDGDVVTLVYSDQDTGNGEAGVASVQVDVDCAPPVIGQVSVSDVGADRATVNVQSAEPIRLTVAYGFACSALTETASANAASVTLTNLEPGVRYVFAVTASDVAGNATTDDQGGQCYSFGTVGRVFFEDFEAGLGDFTVDNDIGSGEGLWHASQACASLEAGHTVPGTLYYGDDASCTFETGGTHAGVARSPIVQLTTTTGTSLEFNYFLGTEGGGTFDRASVAVSVDGGPLVVLASTASGGLVVNSGAWQRFSIELGPFLEGLESAEIQLEFAFDTVDSGVNFFPGFYVDDVSVFGSIPPVPCDADEDCIDTRFCNGEESCREGFCAPGKRVTCSEQDSVECTQARCDEAVQGCVTVARDELCNDGAFCNGEEVCDEVSGCQGSAPPCADDIECTFDFCDEFSESCQSFPDDFFCDDGLFCNGFEVCDPQSGCGAGEPPACDDGVNCTIDGCDDSFGCASVPSDELCDDGLFCNGLERCDPFVGSCSTGAPPCGPGETCAEAPNLCVQSCFTATNGAHVVEGRARLAFGVVYLARGSDDVLGASETDVTSLSGSGTSWERVDACPAPPSVDVVEVSVVGNVAMVNGIASDPNSDVSLVMVTFEIFGIPFVLPASGTEVFSAIVPELPVGTHFVSARAFDAAGFVSPPSVPVPFTILPPAAPSIDSIDALVSGQRVEVRGTASDPNDDIESVTVTIRQGNNVVASGVAFTAAPFSVTIDRLAAGVYTARAQAVDATGRASVLSASVRFEVDAAGNVECFTAKNVTHRSAARARSVLGNRFYFALGSDDFLGVSGEAVTSLQGAGTFWKLTARCE